jgi:hypothetical protein
MKEYQLTNTTKGFISLLEERNINYHLNSDGKGGTTISIWLHSDQELFHLAQDYEQRREELNARAVLNEHVHPVIKEVLGKIIK